MDKSEIKRGMKMARMVHDALLDGRFVKRSELNSDTGVATATCGLQLAIGDNQPVNKSVWLDTSKYSSVNGAIQTYSPTVSGGNLQVVTGDIQPTDTSVAWINTSGYSGV